MPGDMGIRWATGGFYVGGGGGVEAVGGGVGGRLRFTPIYYFQILFLVICSVKTENFDSLG